MPHNPILQPDHSISFTSDNIAGASPEILEALLKHSTGVAQPYGGDELTQQVEARLKAIFECELDLFLVPTGTAANSLCLATFTPPWGSVLCHSESHINNDECGAPEFYSSGAKLVEVTGDHAKLSPQALQQAAQRKKGDVHSVQPTTVSITQATETGHIYSLDEIQQIGEICHNNGMKLHMDGARFANALVTLDCTPAEMTWRAGVDALSFGATKNGVFAAEAIILFDRSYAQELAFRRKRSGHLFSKMRMLSAQMDAYLTDELWLRNARHANQMAQQLSQGLSAITGIELLGETQANIVFCQMPTAVISNLLEQGFKFYHDRWGEGVVRLVTSFDTSEQDVSTFIRSVEQLSQ